MEIQKHDRIQTVKIDRNNEKLNIFGSKNKEEEDNKPYNILIKTIKEDMQYLNLNKSMENNVMIANAMDLNSNFHTIPEMERPYFNNHSLENSKHAAESMDHLIMPNLISDERISKNFSTLGKPKLKLTANLSGIERKPKNKIKFRYNESLFDTQDSSSPYIDKDSLKSLTANKSEGRNYPINSISNYKVQSRNLSSLKLKSRYGVTFQNKKSSLSTL